MIKNFIFKHCAVVSIDYTMIVIFVALIISVIFILYHYKNDLKQFYTLVKFSKTVPGPSYFELGKQSSESINISNKRKIQNS